MSATEVPVETQEPEAQEPEAVGAATESATEEQEQPQEDQEPEQIESDIDKAWKIAKRLAKFGEKLDDIMSILDWANKVKIGRVDVEAESPKPAKAEGKPGRPKGSKNKPKPKPKPNKPKSGRGRHGYKPWVPGGRGRPPKYVIEQRRAALAKAKKRGKRMG